MKIFIPSYIPDGKLKKSRLLSFKKGLQILSKNKNNEIIIFAQSWDESIINEIKDLLSNNIKIEYHEQNKPAYFRNIGLNWLYNSNDDCAIFCDDDVSLELDNKSKFDTYNCWDYIDKYILNNFSIWDVICFRMRRFISQIIKNKIVLSTWKSRKDFGTGFCIIKNIKKYYNKEIYFDTSLNALEDACFYLECLINKLKVFTIENPYVCEYTSSILFENKQDRVDRNKEAKLRILETINKKTPYPFLKITKKICLNRKMLFDFYVNNQQDYKITKFGESLEIFNEKINLQDENFII